MKFFERFFGRKKNKDAIPEQKTDDNQVGENPNEVAREESFADLQIASRFIPRIIESSDQLRNPTYNIRGAITKILPQIISNSFEIFCELKNEDVSDIKRIRSYILTYIVSRLFPELQDEKAVGDIIKNCFEGPSDVNHRVNKFALNKGLKPIDLFSDDFLHLLGVEYLLQSQIFAEITEVMKFPSVQSIAVDSRDGFLSLSANHSLLAGSPPPSSRNSLRNGFYMPMPSRLGVRDSHAFQNARIIEDISPGNRPKLTKQTTSPVKFLHKIPSKNSNFSFHDASEMISEGFRTSTSITRR